MTGTAPSQFSLTYSQAIDPTTINAADFTINGIGANSFSITPDDLTITFNYNTSPVTSEGLQSENLPTGSFLGQDGSPAGGISGTFYYVKVQLAVQTTSPAPGSVLYAPDNRHGCPVQQGV